MAAGIPKPKMPETDRRLLEFLVCPLTRGPLQLDPEKQELVSLGARIAYPIRGGIPIMLASEARKLEEE
jgi:uncharacterized protein